MKNVTLSLPDDLLLKSRKYAKKHGTTLNRMIREFLKRNVEKEKGKISEAIVAHAKSVSSKGKKAKWKREDAYER